ncbi:unnamed protein product (macronuclear) [Paramecium tetraurelia]|uniref:Uncharacterized protein n=1 Tax=Paramecium tetraurelia TaxID=5888 RepID=A0EI49_PARTE|nr:uncharacterized protein GSPATT00027317001 [Paramecium tetraurelia]CAK94990.1 unnamed protein product [Paramecium tetraurelia]|eukprot:XP_001462363.1 hypothetical protein (macronuclear) [Paramecium tetraurelia strain d4-2]
MDSSISNIIEDQEENDALCIKYEELLIWTPKSKDDVKLKNQSHIARKELSQVGSLATTKEWTKTLLHTSTLISKEAYVRSLNSMEAFYEKKEKESADNQTKSLSPVKHQFEEISDYTFKLLGGIKKVRFRLNSDYQA